MNPIPEKLVNFNLYDDGNRLVGITGEVELPSFESMTSTISGAGILGEVESPNVGHFGSQKLTIPFRVISEAASKLFEPRGQTLTLRADQNSYDTSNGQMSHRALKVLVRGVPTTFTPGKVAVGAATETQIVLELYYIKIELDGFTIIELDKYNYIYVVNGKDYLAEVRANI